ncbi:MAG: CopG family transcriptional regulator [Actinomycetota bacterium]|nr:CopG family transcriptional regulator [Actinomycetota bacterium]
MTERVTITLPDDLVAEIDTLAEASGCSRSSVIREASASWVAGAQAEAAKTRRQHAVNDTLAFLDELAELPVHDERAVGEILREIRGPLDGAPGGDTSGEGGRA